MVNPEHYFYFIFPFIIISAQKYRIFFSYLKVYYYTVKETLHITSIDKYYPFFPVLQCWDIAKPEINSI